MPVANNIMTAAVMAPFVTILSTLILASLQRALDWVTAIAKTPQKGFLRQIKPYIKHVDAYMERVLAGNKFTVNATNILLMAVVILLLVLILEGAQKPKNVVVVGKKKEDRENKDKEQ